MISEESQKITNKIEEKNIKSGNRNFDELKEYLNNHSPAKQIKKYDIGKNFSNELNSLRNFDSSNLKTNYNHYGKTKFKLFLNIFLSKFKKSYRSNFINKNLIKTVDYNCKFVYFPLGVDDGKEILISSPFYTNQVEVIRHVAKSLPVGYRLYLKEHPSSIIHDWRSISEYEEIMNIPNVILIHPNVNSSELFRNCSLVVSISGSSGLEAAFYEVSSIIFSNQDYSKLSSVFKIDEIENLPEIIRNALGMKVKIEELDAYITYIEDNTFNFDYFGLLVDIREKFYSNREPFDTNISNYDMKRFLQDNKKNIKFLAEQFLKEIDYQN